MEAIFGIVFGVIAFLPIYCLLGGVLYHQPKRASCADEFWTGERIGKKTPGPDEPPPIRQ